MTEPLPSRLVEEALRGGGRVRLATLLAALMPIAELRELTRRLGVPIKGGYRIERAPAHVVAPLLAESSDPEVLDAVCEALVAHLRRDGREPPPADTGDRRKLERVLELKDQQIGRLKADLERARDAAARQRSREAELTQRLLHEQEVAARLRAEIRTLRIAMEDRPGPANDDRAQRVHDLERELAAYAESEEAWRRREASQAAEIRRLATEVEDLAARVPKGKRKKAPPTPPPPMPDVFRLPHLTPQFYKSLEGKDRRSIERAVHAVLLFCAEGPTYPGLEVKQLEGMAVWSLRASLKLRVYFEVRDDGDIDVLALVDREDQHTALRRLKER